MESIKPGRGPSMMGGFMGIVVCVFAVIWTVIAASFSGLFALFGVVFLIFSVIITIYNFKNALGKNRYSSFDITDGSEEPDPLNEKFGVSGSENSSKAENGSDSEFCPYCGNAVSENYSFCNKCGKKLP